MTPAAGGRSLARRTLANMGLTAMVRLATLALQLCANIVLARNLSSADYGIVGYAQVFITLLSILSEFGLNSAAIQSRQLSPRMLHTGFTLRMLLGLTAFAAAFVAAPHCATLLGEPGVGDAMKLLAAGFLINGLAFVPSVRILRALDYRKFAAAQMAAATVNAAITIAMAQADFAFWSIVVGNVAATAASALVLNLMVKERLRLVLEPESARHYLDFGGHLFLASTLTFMVMNLDTFMVGTLMGSAALGYYALALTWGNKLCETFASIVNSVLFPTFARIQEDLPRLRAAYLKSLEMVAFLAVGGYLTLFAVSEDFLIHMLGAGTEKWRASLMTLRILCAYGLIRALLEPVGSVVMAVGGIPVLVRANLAAAAAIAMLIYPALTAGGIEGAALVVTVGYACQYLVFLPALKRRLDIGVRDLMVRLRHPLVAAVATLMLVLPLRDAGLLGSGPTRFSVTALLCGVIYAAMFGLVSRGAAYRELYNLVRSRRQDHDR